FLLMMDMPHLRHAFSSTSRSSCPTCSKVTSDFGYIFYHLNNHFIHSIQLTSHSKPPEVARGLFKPYIPVFQRKAKAKETPEEICRYMPHHPLQNSTTGSPLMHSGNVTSVANVYKHRDENGNNEEYNVGNLNESEECTTRTRAFNRKNIDLSSVYTEKKDERNPRQLKVQPDLEINEIKKQIRNKLMLGAEQQSKLLDLDNADLGGTKPEHQSQRMLEISEWKDADGNMGKNIFKQSSLSVPLPFANDALPTSSAETKDIPKSLDSSVEEHLSSQPKSPLRLIASAIKRSILEPLVSHPESIKKSTDSKANPTSEHTFFNSPNMSGCSVHLRNSNGNRKHDKSSCDSTKPENSSGAKTEDVPRLLENFTLKETPQRASTDDLCICNQKNLLFSSLSLKNKTSEDILGNPAQMNDICALFSNLRNEVNEREKNDSLMSSMSFINNLSPEKVLNNPSTDEDSVPKPLGRPSFLYFKAVFLSFIIFIILQAIQRQLEEVEERQRALEINGVKLERELRGESDSGTQDETQLLHDWFELVLEKNKLVRYESELLIIAQELELEDHQRRLEQKLREKMAIDDSLKDERELNEEHEIFTEMMKVIEERDKLVSSLEEQRLKEKAEDQHLESFILSKGYQLTRT
uniref:BMERB domain-containing protein n=1 Tax=Gopherus agassizii TaxID=38772 RepID=A0A452H4H5_9SAUR